MYKLSVVIPTCNRSEYLFSTIKSIINSVENIEVIISDNSDNSMPVKEMLDKINNKNIKYQYIKKKLSVIENFESSLKLATGKYIIIIGDDDSLGIELDSTLAKADKLNAEALFFYSDRFIVNYYWPGISSVYFGSEYSETLYIKKYTKQWEEINPKKELTKVINRFGGGLGSMPRIYHGLVRRDLLDKVRDKYGAIFGGVSPDIYSATLLSLEATRVYYIDLPFVIPGASIKSTAGQGTNRKDRGRLHSVDHIKRFGSELKWNPLIPEFYGPQNVWSYSMLCALNKANIKIKPNYINLYLKNLICNRIYIKEIIKSLQIYLQIYGKKELIKDLIISIYLEIESYTKRIYWKCILKNYVYKEVKCIENAVRILKKHDMYINHKND